MPYCGLGGIVAGGGNGRQPMCRAIVGLIFIRRPGAEMTFPVRRSTGPAVCSMMRPRFSQSQALSFTFLQARPCRASATVSVKLMYYMSKGISTICLTTLLKVVHSAKCNATVDVDSHILSLMCVGLDVTTNQILDRLPIFPGILSNHTFGQLIGASVSAKYCRGPSNGAYIGQNQKVLWLAFVGLSRHAGHGSLTSILTSLL